MASATNEAMRRAQSFMALLDEKGYRYDYLHEREGDHRDGMVALSFGGGSFSFASIRVFVDFDYNNAGEGDSVHMWCSDIVSFPDDRRRAALEAINEVGIKKRFVRYYLDKDGDLTADSDFWIGADSAAQRACDHMTTFVSVIDDTYEDLQKARWN
ncbi:MAG: YbjN domain-containing protein [Atopobiaceae bacterium]|nr:YbjN domain-containing protein [Atopobiaceae bacterium]